MKNNIEKINAFANIILAVTSITTLIYSYCNFKQIKSQELIKYRAYISTSMTIIKNDLIRISLKNNGTTPAYNVKPPIIRLVEATGNEHNSTITSGYSNDSIAPGQTINIDTEILNIKDLFKIIQEGSKNYLEITIHYTDYSQKERTTISQINLVKMDDDTYKIIYLKNFID
jgi:hypothetical protein